MTTSGNPEPERAGPDGPEGRVRLVHFYDDDAGLIDVVSRFLAEGLRASASCVVFATAAHRDALEAKLTAEGFDIVGARLLGHYIWMDAAETLAHILAGGWPSGRRFGEVVGGALRRARAGGRRVYVVRGMVPLLWAEGHHDAALRCQELWETEIAGDGLSVLTAFPVKNLVGPDKHKLFDRLSSENLRIIPPAPPRQGDPPDSAQA